MQFMASQFIKVTSARARTPCAVHTFLLAKLHLKIAFKEPKEGEVYPTVFVMNIREDYFS